MVRLRTELWSFGGVVVCIGEKSYPVKGLEQNYQPDRRGSKGNSCLFIEFRHFITKYVLFFFLNTCELDGCCLSLAILVFHKICPLKTPSINVWRQVARLVWRQRRAECVLAPALSLLYSIRLIMSSTRHLSRESQLGPVTPWLPFSRMTTQHMGTHACKKEPGLEGESPFVLEQAKHFQISFVHHEGERAIFFPLTGRGLSCDLSRTTWCDVDQLSLNPVLE